VREHPRTALITGASSGIGEAFAEVFAAHGDNLVITARRVERLQALAKRLEQTYRVHVDVIPCDLSMPGAPAQLCGAIAARRLVIDALVNNAGYGVPGVYTKTTWDQHAAFLNVLVVAVAELTHRLLPAMIERHFGRVINVASLAAFVPAPAGHTMYAASKAFLVKFSEALSHEVLSHGVYVTAVCPGFTLSEFHDVTGTREAMSRLPAFMWMDAATVAREAFEANARGQAVIVTGGVNRGIALLARYLPQWLVSAVNRRAARSYRST
jgi:uncharacterized protein